VHETGSKPLVSGENRAFSATSEVAPLFASTFAFNAEALAWRERMVLVRNPAYCSKRSTPSLHIGGRLLRLLLGVIAKHMRQQRAAGRERLGGRTIGGRGNREWGGGTRV
jgi:hypothetical protein